MNQKSKLNSTLVDIDKIIDTGNATSDLLNNCINVMNSLHDLEKLNSLEVAQKTKTKWSIEGDENSKYFHGILNKRRNNLAIRGISVDGVWIDSPSTVKNEFLSHFANRFDCPSSNRVLLDMNFPNHISLDTKADLERKKVTKEELKRAVWDCGLDKSPRPNGMFKGVSIGSTLHLSHLFYADDVGFMRKWSNSNISTIVNVLKCFFHASGLRINMHKSKLMGNAVDDVKVKQVAHSLGCLQLEPPFSNLVKSSLLSIWLDIIRELINLKNQAINLLGLIKKKIRNGFDTSFWEDTWKGDIAFKFLYPRVFELESSNQISVASKLAHDNIVFSLHCFPKGGSELEQYSNLMNSLNGF
ncbi:hypothetical protein Tco_0885292 [Tanacetum coccineum]